MSHVGRLEADRRKPSAMGNLWYRWLPLCVLTAVWTGAWLYLWQSHLLDSFAEAPGPGLTVFTDRQGDLQILWIASGTGLVLAWLGVVLLAQSNTFRSFSPMWSRIWLVSGITSILIGLSLPLLFPSTTTLVIEEHERTVALEGRWLYAANYEALPFDDIARVALRVQRRAIGGPNDNACQIATGLSLVRHDRTWMEVPRGFGHEEVASRVAEVVGVPLETTGVREC